MEYIKLCEVISSAKTERCGASDYPVLSITKSDGVVLQSDKFKKRIASTDTEQYKLVKRGQLVQGIHIDEANFGIQSIVDIGIVSPAYKIWNVNFQKIVPKYLETVLRSPRSVRYYSLKFNGSVKRRERITDSDFLAMEIPFPSKEQQQYAVDVLEKACSMTTLYQQQLQKLDELVKARFVELFGTISEEVPLSYYIAGLNAGKSLAGEEENPNKVLKTGAVSYDYFDAIQIKNLPIDYEPQESHRVKTGDVIISRMNTAELVGATAYVWSVPEHIYLPDRLWRADVKDTANPIFVWQLLIQGSTKKNIRRMASGTSGSMKNISKSGLLEINVVKAPINLQDQFAAFVTQTDKSKVVVQKALDEAQLLFDSLMQKYFG